MVRYASFSVTPLGLDIGIGMRDVGVHYAFPRMQNVGVYGDGLPH